MIGLKSVRQNAKQEMAEKVRGRPPPEYGVPACAHWQKRKEAYLAHLDAADDDVLRVSLADKVHNARAILRDLRKPDVGETIWSRFSQPREKTLWYYRGLADKFRKKWPGQLAEELHEIVEVLEDDGAGQAGSPRGNGGGGKTK